MTTPTQTARMIEKLPDDSKAHIVYTDDGLRHTDVVSGEDLKALAREYRDLYDFVKDTPIARTFADLQELREAAREYLRQEALDCFSPEHDDAKERLYAILEPLDN